MTNYLTEYFGHLSVLLVPLFQELIIIPRPEEIIYHLHEIMHPFKLESFLPYQVEEFVHLFATFKDSKPQHLVEKSFEVFLLMQFFDPSHRHSASLLSGYPCRHEISFPFGPFLRLSLRTPPAVDLLLPAVFLLQPVVILLLSHFLLSLHAHSVIHLIALDSEGFQPLLNRLRSAKRGDVVYLEGELASDPSVAPVEDILDVYGVTPHRILDWRSRGQNRLEGFRLDEFHVAIAGLLGV